MRSGGKLPGSIPWIISGVGLALLVGGFFLDPDGERYSYWLAILTSAGIALVLAAPVTILTRNLADDLADDIAVDVADGAAADDDVPAEGDTDRPGEVAPAVADDEVVRLLQDHGWGVTSRGTQHEVWRKGRDRIVVPRATRNQAAAYERVRARVERGERVRGQLPAGRGPRPPRGRP